MIHSLMPNKSCPPRTVPQIPLPFRSLSAGLQPPALPALLSAASCLPSAASYPLPPFQFHAPTTNSRPCPHSRRASASAGSQLVHCRWAGACLLLARFPPTRPSSQSLFYFAPVPHRSAAGSWPAMGERSRSVCCCLLTCQGQEGKLAAGSGESTVTHHHCQPDDAQYGGGYQVCRTGHHQMRASPQQVCQRMDVPH